MPKPVEILETESRTVACDGGGGALGHQESVSADR